MSRYNNECVNGFVKTDGRRMVNGNGEQIVLRGYGTGNWTNPEGFMVGGTTPFSGSYSQPKKLDRARSMDALIRELCGSKYADEFWPKWYRKHLGERDIQAMAELGYNSVRLVLNSAAFLFEEPGITFNEDSFRMLDDVLHFCEKYRIYAILDMHAAPGGQSAGACDNGVDSEPHLFIDEENWERAIVLWEEFARRYKDRWIIAGYDLLNEPLNTKESLYLVPKLSLFYDELIARIRMIDRNHMLTIECPIWSTYVSFFDHNFDPYCNNWCIHIHNYGFRPDMQELYTALERSISLDVPIWIGEGGSSNTAQAVFFEMCAKEGIGFNLWCWKSARREDTNAHFADMEGPASHKLPADWSLIFNYADKGGPKPGYMKCQQIFDELLDNLEYDKCMHPKKKHKYTLRQPGIVIPGVGYDHGKSGEAFKGDWEYGNAYEFRIADRMKMVIKPGGKLPAPRQMYSFIQSRMPDPLDNLWLELAAGEFVHYTIREVQTSSPVSMVLRSIEDAEFSISYNDMQKVFSLKATDEAQKVYLLTLPKGDEYAIKVAVISGILQIAEVHFDDETTQ